MGGTGSGWYERCSNRSTTDDYPSVDVRVLAREYRLDEGFILAGGVSVDLNGDPATLAATEYILNVPIVLGSVASFIDTNPKTTHVKNV